MKLRVHLWASLAACAVLVAACAHQSEDLTYIEASRLVARMPAYPSRSVVAHEEGKVQLRVSITEYGLPSLVEVVSSSGSAALDREAVDAVRKWTFKPAIRGGKPVASTLEVPIDFRITYPYPTVSSPKIRDMKAPAPGT